MSLVPGQTLASYEILALLGKGGMGEVYRARDPALKRDVAIKVLPEGAAGEADRLARFRREAESLAALDHPNIATVYGLERSGDSPAIVMELVEGATLAERIETGRIPLDEALCIARQIAEALEVAHERGIVHRDLKPANVKVRDDGSVKVLDFGLAKAVRPDPASSDAASSPTLTGLAPTGMGVILGTAGYMAPEQARGKAVDKRTDIWAFGVVLYEMLTGDAAFPGADVTQILARVIEREPDWSRLPADVPPVLRAVLGRCLHKDPKQRIRDIGDVGLALDGAFDPGGTGEIRSAGRRPGFLLPVATLVLGAALAGLATWAARAEPPQPVLRMVVSAPPNPPVRPDVDTNRSDVVISPDGTRVMYRAVVDGDRVFMVRELDRLEAAALEGPVEPFDPFFSPDGRWVGFMPGGGALQKVSLLGGPAETICELPSPLRGAVWGGDGTIVFGVAGGSLMRVSADGGQPEVLTEPPVGVAHRWPALLPGGAGVLFTIDLPGADRFQVAVLDLETREHKVVLEGGAYGRYVPTGHLLYAAAGSLRAVPFELGSLEVTGDPVRLLDGIVTKGTGAADYAVSETGSLVYVTGPDRGRERTFVWVDREGREESLPIAAARYWAPRLSPDGRRLAATRQDRTEVWIFDTATGAGLPLASGRNPVWTPDGERILFSRSTAQGTEIHAAVADRSGAAEHLLTSEFLDLPLSVTPDGQTLLLARNIVPARQQELWGTSLEGDPTPFPIHEGTGYVMDAEVSSNGSWLAYDPGLAVLRPYPGDGPTIPLPRGTGIRRGLAWAPDDSAMYVRDHTENRFMVVDVRWDGEVRLDPPRSLFNDAYVTESAGSVRQFDVAPDGRFLMMKAAASGPPEEPGKGAQWHVILVQNWFEELGRLASER